MPIAVPIQDKILTYLKKHGKTHQHIIQVEFNLKRQRVNFLRISMSKARFNRYAKLQRDKSISVTQEGRDFFWEAV